MLTGTKAEKELAEKQNDSVTKGLVLVKKQLAELNNKDGDIFKLNETLQTIAKLSDINQTKRFELLFQIEEAIAAGDHDKVIRLKQRLSLLDEKQAKYQLMFDVTSPLLQKSIQDYSDAFYKLATSPVQQLLDPIDKAANEQAEEITKRLIGTGLFSSGSAAAIGGTAGGFLKFLDKTALLVQILDPTSNNFLMTGLGLANLNKYLGRIFPEKGVFGSLASGILSGDEASGLFDRPSAEPNMVGPDAVLKQKPAPPIVTGQARGGFVVNKPTYLPDSGIVVGDSIGGIDKDGGPEAVIPLSDPLAKPFFDIISKNIGQQLNRLQMERMSGAGGMAGASVVTGNDMSSKQVSNNTTVINNPSPRGQMLPDEGRDFVSKVG